MLQASDTPLAAVVWRPSFRLIASRFPTVGLYDGVADPADLEVVFAVESLTNPRIRDAIGQLQLVPPEQRISGPGSTPIMAAFTHLNPLGSRFSDGSYGVYYTADTLETAVAEVSHHRAAFFARTEEPAIDIDMRLITADLDATLHDLRSLRSAAAELYDPDRYGASQDFGRALRGAGSLGVVYESVRHAGGTCVGMFSPRGLRNARQSAHIGLRWDGARISHWYRKDEPTELE